MKLRVLTVAAMLLIQSLSITTASADNRMSAIGMNTNEAMDINASVPFIDLFKLSLPFEEARPWYTKGRINYDKNGWPTSLNGGQAGTRFISNLPANTIPSGIYTVLYKGEGTLKYGVNAKLISRSAGKDLIEIKPGKNKHISASLIITQSNPNNYLRDIRILFPGGICANNPFKRIDYANQCGNSNFLTFERHHQQILFNPDYLNFMKDFKVIRFMNMSGITRNDRRTWQQRPHMEQASWGGKEGRRGVPLEVMINLANQLNIDPWFTFPHRADNQFVRRYAQMVNKRLKTTLKAYVEYTNEAWNGIFSQHHYIQKKGEALQLDADKTIAGYKFYSKRSVEIFKIWQQVAGGTNRMIRVMGGMTTNANMTEMLLGYQDAYRHTDALAIAPYFYIKDVKKIRSVNHIFQQLKSKKNRHSIPNILNYVKTQAQHAQNFGVDLIAYEGGQHLVAYNTHTIDEGPNPHLIQANKDKRMADLYYQFLQGWKKAGGKLFVAFSAPRQYTWIGSWGIKEYITQPTHKAPKYRALLAFNNNESCWWDACASTYAITRHAKPATNPSLVTLTRLFKPMTEGITTTNINNKRRIDVPKMTPMQASYKGNIARKNERPRRIIENMTRPTAKFAKKPLANTIINTTSNIHTIPYVTNPQYIFSHHSPYTLHNIVNGSINGIDDLAASWQAHWDQHYLHLKVDVTDDNFVKDSQAPWSDDSIEIFIDADGSRLAQYDRRNDFQFFYRWKDYRTNLGNHSPQRDTKNIIKRMSKVSNGYVLETSIPWRTLGVKPISGQAIGIDIHINDDDDGNQRDSKLTWIATDDSSWRNPQSFGQLILGNPNEYDLVVK